MGRSNTNCCIVGCTNTVTKASIQRKLISFYLFPTRPWLKERREIWIKFVDRVSADGTPWTPTKNSYICSEHFVGGCKSEDPRHPSYNPTIYDPKKGPKEDPKVTMERYKRAVARWNRQKEGAPASEQRSFPQENEQRKVIKTISSSGNTNYRLTAEPEVIEVKDEPPSPSPSFQADVVQSLCLICCEYCPENADHDYQTDATFMRFLKLLYQTPNTPIFDSLKSFDHLSVCSSCLTNVETIVARNSVANLASEKVRKLQRLLLNEMKLMNGKLRRFHQEMKKLQDSVRASQETRLNNYLKGKEKTVGMAVVKFRDKIVENVDLLEEFGHDLQRKVNCLGTDNQECSSPPRQELDSNLGSRGSPVLPETSHSTQENVVPPKTISPTSNKTPLKSPIVLGKTVRWKTKVVVEHVWDGVNFTEIQHPPELPSTPPVVVTPKKSVACPACKKEMKLYYLSVHRKYYCPFRASQQNVLCHVCSKTFASTRRLYRHVKLMHSSEEKRYMCSRCAKAFKTGGCLRAHERTHSTEWSFICRKGCGGGFKHPRNRSRHEDLCDGSGTPVRKKAKQVVPPTAAASADIMES